MKRVSRRKYKKTPIESEKVTKLKKEIGHLNKASGLNIAFVEDASRAFSSMLKTYGMFSGVRSVLVMKGNRNDPFLAEKIGYYGEELVLYATDLGLGTCWVAGTFDRKKFIIPDKEEMLCVIPVGNVDEQSGKEKVLRKYISGKRKSADKRLINYPDAPQWAKNAMEAVRLAPSAVNSQKPMFRWKNGLISAYVRGYNKEASGHTFMYIIDLGIAKKHFEIEAGGTFALGQGALFTKSE